MEGLAVRERVLGASCPDLPHPIVFRGAVFADEARFDRCLALWRRALQLRHQNSVCYVLEAFPCPRTSRLLLECGVDVDAADECRRTALHLALISYQIKERELLSDALCGVVCELISHDAHVDACDMDGLTPLLYSIGGKCN
ncbi:Feminization 1-like protein [Operophtera brumata]|uniref:Feminization 1-like protein n=1 Tax=Operophtera brumata TaxID=104452 RepID=A0A0L7LBR7_OPEBR|nr:Feminization 1-like protein [Operophtera brumata]